MLEIDAPLSTVMSHISAPSHGKPPTPRRYSRTHGSQRKTGKLSSALKPDQIHPWTSVQRGRHDHTCSNFPHSGIWRTSVGTEGSFQNPPYLGQPRFHNSLGNRGIPTLPELSGHQENEMCLSLEENTLSGAVWGKMGQWAADIQIIK